MNHPVCDFHGFLKVSDFMLYHLINIFYVLNSENFSIGGDGETDSGSGCHVDTPTSVSRRECAREYSPRRKVGTEI